MKTSNSNQIDQIIQQNVQLMRALMQELKSIEQEKRSASTQARTYICSN